MYYSTQKSGFELRKKASEISGSQFILKGPSTVKPGEKFTVDLVLDTSTDPKYTISAADAIVSYSSTSKIPPSECKGQIPQCPSFMAPPESCPYGTMVQDKPVNPCECAPPPRCVINREIMDGIGTNSSVSTKSFINAQFMLLDVIPGKIFESYPTLPASPKSPAMPPVESKLINGQNEIALRPQETIFMPEKILTNPVAISGVKNYAVTDQGTFSGFSGSGVFATLSFNAPQDGSLTISLGYNGTNATDDSNINGFLKDSPVSLQKPTERLLTAPQALTIKINNEQNIITPSTTPAPPITCGGFAGIQCPNGMECMYPTENSDTVNKIGTPDQMGTCVTRITPTKPISPSGQFYCENPLIGRPAVMPLPRTGTIPFSTDLGIGAIIIDRGGNTAQKYQPAILGKDYKGIQWNYLGSTNALWSETIPSALTSFTYKSPGTFRPMYRIIGYDDQIKQTCTTEVEFILTVGQVPLTLTPTPSPSPTPRPMTGTVNAQVKFEGYANGSVEVSLFGLLDLPKPYPYTDTKNNNSLMFAPEQANVPMFLGKGTTNPNGSVRITVGREFLSKPYYLFVETPLHLRKYQISNPKPVVLIPDCTGEICTTEIKNMVTFGELIPGDINGDTYGKKDQIINSFDVSVLYTQWSGADEKEVGGFSYISKKPAGNGDLNRDGVVNTRDLALLLANFNKRGETQPAIVAPASILDKYREGMIGPPVNLNLPNP